VTYISMKFILKILLLCIFPFTSFSQQDTTDMVKYTPEFKFREGIYLNFSQVKSNTPLPKSRIIATLDYDDPNFFDRVLEGKYIYYYDNIGNRNELKSDKIWGYSRNGFLYIRMDDGYFRITLIGSVCHFIASETYYTTQYNSPYYYNSYMDPYRMYPNTYPTTEMRQYLLDFKNGRVLDYTEESLEVILMQDPELHDEYTALSNKKKKQLKFLYMRKYNQRNPLYFPQN